jgi:hypothetical protein
MSLSIILVPFVWLLKSLAYVVVFRLRKIQVTYLSCLIIAGAPLLLGLIPIPLPGLFSVVAGMALAVYLTMHYARVSLFPDGLFIPLGVELLFKIGIWVVQELISAS